MARVADALRRAKLQSAAAFPAVPEEASRPAEMFPFLREDGNVAPEWKAPVIPEPPALEPAREHDVRAEAPADPAPPVDVTFGAADASSVSRLPRIVAAVTVLAAMVAAFLYARTPASAVTHVVRTGAISEVIAGKGKVEPPAEVRVSAKMLGRLKAVHVNEGDIVRQGDLLATMDDEELVAQLARARAGLEQSRARYAEVLAGPRPQEVEAATAQVREAEAIRTEASASLERLERLFGEGLVAAAQRDEARLRSEVADAQLRAANERLTLLLAGARPEVRAAAGAEVQRAEAEVRAAEAQLANARVPAPISGRVLRRYMEPGEVIVLQRPQPIVTLADVSRVLVRTEIDETDLRKVRVGQSAIVHSDAYPSRSFAGRVVEVGRSVGRRAIDSEDPTAMMDARVLEAIVELEPGAPLQFGLTVDVEIASEERHDAVLVPHQALIERGGATFVRVRADGRDAERQVRVGLDDGTNVEIVSGLEAGAVVLSEESR
jgi:ABC exporter DevB family membrane fusion protein